MGLTNGSQIRLARTFHLDPKLLTQYDIVLPFPFQKSFGSAAVTGRCDQTQITQRNSPALLSGARTNAFLSKVRLRRSLMIATHPRVVFILVRLQGESVLRLTFAPIALAQDQVLAVSIEPIRAI